IVMSYDIDLVRKLEAATQASLAPPNLVTASQRQEAEEFILSFRQSKVPFHVCKEILENSATPSVQYQAALTLKEAIVREWTTMDQPSRLSLQQFILCYLTQRNGMAGYVREILSRILAVMLKRSSVACNDPEHRHPFYQHLASLLSSGNEEMERVGCSILSSICVEFSASDKSSNVGLTWEEHVKCKVHFEKNDLQQIFQLITQVLQNADPNKSLICAKYYDIAEIILTWKFSPDIGARRRTALEYDPTVKINFEPPKTWKSQILDPRLVQLFFMMHSKIRGNEQICHTSLICLAQLATLQGQVCEQEQDVVNFLSNFLQNFLHVYSSVTILGHEALGISNVIRSLVETHKLNIWAPTNLFPHFLEITARFTINFGIEASKEEQLHEDDQIYMDSCDNLLDVWTTLIERMNDHDKHHLIGPWAVKIVENYIKYHISPPDGSREQTKEGGDLEEEVEELEEEDRDRFASQLISISSLAHKKQTNKHPPTTTRLLEDRTNRLHGQLQRLKQNGNYEVDEIMTTLYEDHWLILLAGHTLADECEGETPLIPPEILQHSIDQKPLVDETTTMNVLGSPQMKIGEIPGAERTDHVVRLSSAVLRVSEIETESLKTGMIGLLSPQLSEDILWFLRIWAATYLLYKEEYYKELSPVLSCAFGRDSDGSKWLIRHLVIKIMTSLTHWGSETKVLDETTKLLLTLVESNERCHLVVECPEFWDFISKFCQNIGEFSNLPISVKQNIMSAIIHTGSTNMNQYKDKYWQQTLAPIQNRYHSLVNDTNFIKSSQNEGIMEEISTILSMYQGVACASTPQNSTLLFSYLSHVLAGCSKLVDVYHNCGNLILLILELFVEVAHKQICYITKTQCQHLYEWSMHILKAILVTKFSNKTRISKYFNMHICDLNIFFHSFQNNICETEINLSGADDILAADVVLFGLEIILPHLNTQLLLYPLLCSEYFKLITFLCEIYPEKIDKLSEQMLTTFIHSLQIGLSSYGTENCKLCLEALEGLANHCGRNQPANLHNPSNLHIALAGFVKPVFDTLIVHTTNMEILRAASDTFYLLTKSHPQLIDQLFQQIIATQPDPAHKVRLSEAFHQLPVQPASDERTDRPNFIKTLEAMVYKIRGILCVK
uniref:Exportin-4 n=1 Tax=Ciona savignyi TaxID=51511 RepID=H2ZC64_CIOSA